MAKQIKIIKCPQCGSIKNVELKPDFYKCESCGAEYYLDNDDININVKHQTSIPTNSTTPNKPNIKAVFAVIAVAFILFFSILKKMVHRSNRLPSNNSVYSPSSSSSISEEREDWGNEEEYFYEAIDKTPVMIRIGNISNGSNSKSFAVSYDAKNGKELSRVELKDISSISDLDYRIFDNDQPYVIINKSKLFSIDKTTKSLNSVNIQSMGNQPLLQSGVAKLEFVYDNYGSGFNIMTNEGRQVYFYPLVDKLYDGNEDFTKARAQEYPNQITKGTFKFSSKSTDYPNEKIQLIKYTYRYKSGYPRDAPYFEWRKDFGGSGIFTDADPYKKVLINNYSIKTYKIVDYTDFTPNRLYFDPQIMYCDERVLLFGFKATPTENAETSLQLLDAKTAKVLWTLPLPKSNNSVNAVVYDGYGSTSGYFINGNYYDLFIDQDGKILQQFKRV